MLRIRKLNSNGIQIGLCSIIVCSLDCNLQRANHSSDCSSIILSKPGGGPKLKSSNMMSRIAPSSTEKRENQLMALIEFLFFNSYFEFCFGSYSIPYQKVLGKPCL